MLNIIKQVAKEVRSQLESHVLTDDKEGRYGNSERVCAVGKCDLYSSQISDMLNENGVCATTVRGYFDGHDHFWTEVGELIVDVTVDQFGQYLPQILIGRYKDWPQYCLCKEKTAEWHNRYGGAVMKLHVKNRMVTQEQFAGQTSLIIPMIVAIVLEQDPNLSESEREWFHHHVDVRVRYLYSTNKLWKRSLKSEGGRDKLYVFVQHWLKAYVQDPARYQSRHPHSVFDVQAAS